ncbi:MAG: XdhC/CoxI family protein [Solirubrobacterales bacterium]|nr:XdhC/CoxI family protein [Solirubrobacterales bacterium]
MSAETNISDLNRATARRWIAEGREIALATLVDIEGSAPLDPGAMMLIDADGNVEGSVTGGCVEGALVAEAQLVLGGESPRVRTYGISDDQAVGVGLMCGGTVRVFVERLDEPATEAVDRVLAAALEGRPAALATLLDGPSAGHRMTNVGSITDGSMRTVELLDHTVTREMEGMLAQGITQLRRYGSDGAAMGSDLRVHIQSFAERPQMVIFGAIDFSVAVAALAGAIGYRVTIVDAREAFLRSPRFTDVAEVAVDWPDRFLEARELGARDAVLVFTHDPKFDEPALIGALGSGAGYVGALGSRRTHRQRVERLLEAGVSEAEIARIAAPCGLDIGARTPAETAVSVLAEVITLQNARSAERLAESQGPIHSHRVPVP